MKWNTPVAIEPKNGYLQHGKHMLSMGSCFADNIGEYLATAKFDICQNPFGTLYNPDSIADALYRLMQNAPFTTDDLSQDGDLWYSYKHHGRFSQPTAEATLKAINDSYVSAARRLPTCERLIVTWGTAYVYRLVSTGQTVANCHKQPASLFRRERLSVEAITRVWSELLAALQRYAPRCQVLFTVSPIRHLRDGAHDNQLSKSTLLLAVEQLCHSFPNLCSYFPAYEIVMDELRDYRFYADDMTHPSQQAVAYIIERMAETYFTPATRSLAETCEKLHRAMQHRPLKGLENESYRSFLRNLLQQMERVERDNPGIEFSDERKLLTKYLSL